MTLDSLRAFWPLALLVPYALLQARFLGALRSLPAALGSPHDSAQAWRRYVARRRLSAWCGAFFWVACVLALSGAIRIPRYVSERVDGAELAFVIDASNSMLTPEGTDRRLDDAIAFASKVASSVDGVSLSLVAFRGGAVTLCPSTRDRYAFNDALRYVGPAVTTTAGSDVGAALDEALRPLTDSGSVRLIMLLSDGNDTGGSAREASARVPAAGARLVLIGFGDDRMRPVVDAAGARVLDQAGSSVSTQLAENSMAEWAAAGKGLFVRADEPGAYSRVAQLCVGAAGSIGKRHDVRVDAEASSALALAALVMLGMALALALSPEWPRQTKHDIGRSRKDA
jgi:Ca-activated chloride channel family protein